MSGYKKETPADAAPNPLDFRPFELWKTYLDKIISPNKHLTPRQQNLIRSQAKVAVQTLFDECAPADVEKFSADDDTAFVLMDIALNVTVTDEQAEILSTFAESFFRQPEERYTLEPESRRHRIPVVAEPKSAGARRPLR